MNEIHVLILHRTPVDDRILSKLRQVSSRLVIEARTSREADNLEDIYHDAEVLFTDDPLPPEGSAPKLRWVQGSYAGVDRWGRLPMTRPYIWTTTTGIHSQVAELVLLLMLAFAHKFPLLLSCQRRAEWPKDRYDLLMPYELRDSTAGIIGYGSIGRQVGSLCRAFGMHVIAYDREVALHQPEWKLPGSAFAEASIPDRVYSPPDIKLLLKESDYVILCVPYTPMTHGMMSADAIASMKPGAVLINVSRGNIVDEEALIGALKTERIRGAGLDVFAHEPLPTASPLYQLPNVIITPHVAGFSPHYLERAMELFAENLRRYVAGEPLLNVVNQEKGY